MPRSELVESALPDVAAWWSEYGRTGWIANRWLDGEAVWELAGEVRGTYRVEEPGRAPRRLIDPAGAGSFTPLTWYDSLRVLPGVGAAWQGFSGALMTVEGRTGGPGPSGAEGIVDLRSGDGGWDENSLMVSRRDSLSWLRVESHGLNRGPAGTMESSGRHLWGVSVGKQFGHHAFEGAFEEQGLAASLLGTEDEDLSGQVGSATYRYQRGGAGGELTFARGRSRAVSFSEYFPLSRRASAATEVSTRVWHPSGFSAGAQWHRERVTREASDAFNVRAASFWSVVGWSGDFGAGRLSVDVGAGKHQMFPNVNFAPAVRYEVRGAGVIARVGAERVLDAVWNELALNQFPFMQRSYAGVADVTLGTTRARQVRATLLAGRTISRAVATRTPLSEVVLRTGLVEDPDPYTFGLASLEARGEWRGWFGNALGYGLTRPTRTIQPNVDPSIGGRALLGARWRMFKGDLGVEAYAGVDYVGARESEFRPVHLFGYATSSAGLLFTLADATITIRARNLENHSPPEPWMDTSVSTDPALSSEAFGPGREIRLALTLNLRN